jgi:hypothetical protein
MTINQTLVKKGFLQVLTLSGVVLLSAAVALAQESAPENAGQAAGAAGGQRTDGQIEMDVVRALDASQALKNDLITAATIQSEVTLAGTVSSADSKKLAESIVTKVPGVTGVHNNLNVGNPQDAQNEIGPQPGDESDPGQPQGKPQEANGQQDNGPMPPPQAYPQQQAPSPYPNGQDSRNRGQYPDQGQNSQAGQYPPPYPQQAPYPYPNDQGQYPDQGQNSQQGQYPQSRPQYAPYGGQQRGYNQPQPAYAPAYGPVTVSPGTVLQLRTSEPLTSRRAQEGQPVQFTVISDVTAGGVLAIPRGATVRGVVTEVKKVGSGDLGGSSALALTLTSLDLGGRNYPLATDQFRVRGPNKAGQTVGNAVAGGLIGTIIGCAAGRGVGCAIGAGAGVAAGTAASAASFGPQVWIPAEALVTFHLAEPLTVKAVSQQEAARLAQGLYPGGPTLYQRPGYANPYYGPRPRYYARYGYPYYAYPRVYYRPYSMAGGFYYWR